MHPGEVIRELRLRNRLTQVALSRRSGVSNQFICDLEHGRALPSAEVVVKLARGFDMDPGELLKLLFPEPGLRAQEQGRAQVSPEAKAA